MTSMKKTNLFLIFPTLVFIISCGPQYDLFRTVGRNVEIHRELLLVDPLTGTQTLSTQAINVGTIYLETQLAPLTVSGVSLQASDVSKQAGNAYISYSSFDIGGVASKIGAVEQVQPYACDNPVTLLHTEFCLSSLGSLSFSTADIFSTFSDGSELYAVGSTSAEDQATPGRLYKVSLNSSKTPTAVIATQVLPSYAGTGVLKQGSLVYATSGTSSVDASKIGGLSIFNASDLTSFTALKSLYDARAVAIGSTNTSKVFVSRGKIDSGNLGALVEYNADGTGSATRTIASGGNTIAESKSSLLVGNELLIASLGDGGFKVLCKASGTSLATQAAVTVSGIAASKTVTNSIAAAPGYIFAANGEAGVYVYKFTKSSALNSNYCQGVSLNFLGRLSLDSDGLDSTYTNAELSANSIYYMPLFSVLNVLTSKLIVVASGNKGLSLINISAINVGLTDVDDF